MVVIVVVKIYFNMLGIGHNYFENIKKYLVKNSLFSQVHSNIKRMPKWKTKIVINKDVTTIIKNFFLNYIKVHRLSSLVRNINHII